MKLLLTITLIGASVCFVNAQHANRDQVKKMSDGKTWTTKNINIDLPGSFCYDSLPSNCVQHGRLYTWKAAMMVCGQLGEGWRLPTSDEWKTLAKHYGGIFDDSNDNGKAAYVALTDGGASQFNALLSGGRDLQGGYGRIDAHGFYWTATETNDSMAWFANFGKGRPALYLQNDGEKPRAFAVRCVK
ncbi:DUF1566 domain-containing protein [Fulvivirgaceae bacterium PWU4]|uniref:DUF1566 domain-containing protein n=1 Tax=Chryseosolibacter histidini TaxID=2782349 RepID=A0AAP2DR72_9BACT|nr:FISUMP domain-containing protein [Chryseosolibacter histidini]MBT1701055.1 DUF1566 domain-containing protein [Chryseosolibacter histidini]